MDSYETERQRHRCAIVLPPVFPGTELRQMLLVDEAVRSAAECGYTTFISGMNRSRELEGAQEAIRLGALGDVRVICALPYPGYGREWQDTQERSALVHLLKHADLVRAVSPVNGPDAEWQRYKWMLDRCTRLITYPPLREYWPLHRQCLRYGHAREMDIQFVGA